MLKYLTCSPFQEGTCEMIIQRFCPNDYFENRFYYHAIDILENSLSIRKISHLFSVPLHPWETLQEPRGRGPAKPRTREYTNRTHLKHLWVASVHHVYEPCPFTSGCRIVRIFCPTSENFLLLLHKNSYDLQLFHKHVPGLFQRRYVLSTLITYFLIT